MEQDLTQELKCILGGGLEKLDKDLSRLYIHMKKESFSDEEIAETFKPLLGESPNTMRKIIILIFSCFIIYRIMVMTELGWWVILAMFRTGSHSISPFYDTSQLGKTECLVEKWWRNDMVKNETPNCNLCENLRTVEFVDDIDNEELEQLYMDVQKPIVLSYEGVPTVVSLWTSLFQDENYLKSYPCFQETNVMANQGSVWKILQKLSIFPNFFAHFQNCNYESMKYFRNIVPIHKSIPKQVSPVQYNWLMWSRNYSFPNFKKIELMKYENVKMVGQVNGEILYRLIPAEFCRQSCADVEVKLRRGQALIFTNRWSLEYKVTSIDPEVENVAVVSEAHTIHSTS